MAMLIFIPAVIIKQIKAL